jgi:hypothetical protein
MGLGSCTRTGRAAVLLAVCVACLSVPALASARVTVPPGATEGDQYFEEAPNGGGSGSVDKSGGAGGSSGVQPVAGTQSLDQLGPDGKAAAALANANRPPAPDVKLGQGQQPPPSQPSSSSEGEGGMGFWFPLLIVLTAVAAIAYGLRRRLMPV